MRSQGRGSVLSWLATIAIAVSGPSAASAAPSAGQVCGDLAKQAQRTLWSSVREAGDAMFCRKSWVAGRPDELAACGLWTQTQLFSNKLKNLWNRWFAGGDAGWATWGPRGISADWEDGTIRQDFKRTFFGAGLAYSKSTVEVVKRGGKAEAFVTACALDYDGKVVAAQQRSFAAGQGGDGKSVEIALDNRDNHIIGVVVDTPLSIHDFEYRARLVGQPIRNTLAPVKGVADLHVHQLVNLAFGGRMYWGLHDGPESSALAREVVNPTGSGLDLSNPVSLADQLTDKVGLDANILFAVFGGKTTDEGFFKYGGEGYPSYRDWPHHADRSHQQVYLPWLREAHTRNADSHSNMNLIVVSLVNNNILCSVARLFDPYGNVPTHDSTGRITGWESASWGCSDHENVVRQLDALHAIEKANPWYRIAMSPWHARQIIADGDLAVVVSMETDKPLSGEGNNYGDWLAQLDFYRARGLSTMQVVHESDSKFCGAAPHRNMMTLLQLVHFPLRSVLDLLSTGSTFKLDANRYNELGITEEGNRLIDAMMQRNMPIDLAHASQRCRKDIRTTARACSIASRSS
jgi:membrane dipeptidase (peptidase family M19)